jgi:hypothetical protein
MTVEGVNRDWRCRIMGEGKEETKCANGTKGMKREKAELM